MIFDFTGSSPQQRHQLAIPCDLRRLLRSGSLHARLRPAEEPRCFRSHRSDRTGGHGGQFQYPAPVSLNTTSGVKTVKFVGLGFDANARDQRKVEREVMALSPASGLRGMQG